MKSPHPSEVSTYADYLPLQSQSFGASLVYKPQGLLKNENYSVQIDQREYGGASTIPFKSVEFSPGEMGILEKYVDRSCLYPENVSPTTIYLSQDLASERVSWFASALSA